MRSRASTPGIVSLLCFACFASGGDLRVWTSSVDGRRIRAEFVGMKGGSTVQIKTVKGYVFEAPLATFSAKDREYIHSLALQETAGSRAGAGSSTMASDEISLVLHGVNLCCEKAVLALAKLGKGRQAAMPEDVVLVGDHAQGRIRVVAQSGESMRQALERLLEAGYYGQSDHAEWRMPDLAEDERRVDELHIHSPSLCCQESVRRFVAAVKAVSGVEGCDAQRGMDRVKVVGRGFRPNEVMQALRNSGFGGRIQ